MKTEEPVSSDEGILAHLCPKCASNSTIKITSGGQKSDGHETWKCRDCKHTWDMYVGPIEQRPEKRVF
jgi:transposase-like protein